MKRKVTIFLALRALLKSLIRKRIKRKTHFGGNTAITSEPARPLLAVYPSHQDHQESLRDHRQYVDLPAPLRSRSR
ncbi:MAG: hypothetical protein CL831_10625 [Crocinitomicaceae bacterium]|nr:hypothetical protein [Crocinitomicaceae bacterium]